MLNAKIECIEPTGSTMDEGIGQSTRYGTVAANDEQRVSSIGLNFRPEHPSGRMIQVFNPNDVSGDCLGIVNKDGLEFLLADHYKSLLSNRARLPLMHNCPDTSNGKSEFLRELRVADSETELFS